MAWTYETAVAALDDGPLPAGFDQWALTGKGGKMVAHEAARRSLLPESFDQWHLQSCGHTVAHMAARAGCLPEDSNRLMAWKDRWGTTVAHVAARYCKLPKGFDQWRMLNRNGKPVAHVAAQFNRLPDDFEDWGIAYKNRTIAHEMASHRSMPKHFNQWDLMDGAGVAVAHICALYRKMPKNFRQWHLVNGRTGETVAHMAVRMGRLPIDELPSAVWRLLDRNGTSVWETARQLGRVTGDPPPLPMPTIKPGDFSPVPPLF